MPFEKKWEGLSHYVLGKHRRAVNNSILRVVSLEPKYVVCFNKSLGKEDLLSNQSEELAIVQGEAG